MAVADKKIEALRQVYVGIGDAIQALKENESLKEKASVLEKSVTTMRQKINDLATVIKGLETISGKRVEVCPECLGAGAYQIKGEVEECDNCDGAGWIER